MSALATGALSAQFVAFEPPAPPPRAPIEVETAFVGQAPLPDPALAEVQLAAIETPVLPPTFEGHSPDRRFGDGMVISGGTPHRLILFTFDDGPDLRYTPKLLDTLDELGVRAVFFLTADRIVTDNGWGQRQAELARDIAARGHVIGSHGYDHKQMPLLDDAGVLRQLELCEQIFEKVFGERPWLFRPPGGARSDRTDRLIEGRGYTQMLWNLGTGDFQVRTPEAVVETWLRVLDRREAEFGERGGIVLLHDIHPWSVEAVPQMVAEIRRRNCELLEKNEELYDIVDDPRFFFVPRADAPFGSAAPALAIPPEVLERRQARLRTETEARCRALVTGPAPSTAHL